jgi:hypothetical protein
MSSGSPPGSQGDQRTVAQETEHQTCLTNHERHDSVPDYDGLASQMDDYQNGGLCVWISDTHHTKTERRGKRQCP